MIDNHEQRYLFALNTMFRRWYYADRVIKATPEGVFVNMIETGNEHKTITVFISNDLKRL